MERKIGEIFEYNGEWYQCVDAIDGCRECSFRAQDYCTCHSECMSLLRSDKTSVIFKKLEKIGTTYIENGKLYQKYKVFEPVYGINEDELNTVIAIEIKQEDMEDRKQAFKILVGKYLKGDSSYDDFEKAVEELFSDKKDSKPTLKEFDLEAAKLGKPVCTRDGRKARIICFNKVGKLPIIALVKGYNGNEDVFYYLNCGKDNKDMEKDYDLMMLPEKKEGWAKVRKDINLYDTKEEADRKMIGNDEYVTAKVCWEE